MPRKFGVSRGRRARGGGRDFLGLDPRDTRSNRGWHGFNRQVDASEVRMEWTARERIRNKTTPPCCSINMGSLSSFLRAPKRPDRQRIHQKRNSPPLLFNKHGFTVSFLPRPHWPSQSGPSAPPPTPAGTESSLPQIILCAGWGLLRMGWEKSHVDCHHNVENVEN